MIYHLKIGSLGEAIADARDSESSIERDALLVYTGIFQSADGEVKVDDDHLERLSANHNGLLSKVKRLATAGRSEIPLKYYPPIQLDHSTSAKDTIGRLVGNVDVRETEINGEKVKALFGRVRILGRENVERVLDGRWTNLSIGADFDEGYISEVTVTPFPAASDASLLSRKHELKSFYDMTPRQRGIFATNLRILENIAATKKYDAKADHKGLIVFPPKNFEPGKSSKEMKSYFLGALDHFKSRLDHFKFKITGHSDPSYHQMFFIWVNIPYEDAYSKLSSEEPMNKDKLKKKLMDKGMKEDEAEKELSRLSDDSAKDELAKLQKEIDDDELSDDSDADDELTDDSDADDKGKEAKLTAAREKIKKLSIGFKQSLGATRLAAKQSTILNRLSKLRADGKITPAEIKKMDISKLSASSDEAISLVLQSYEDREPVIMAGMIGDSRSMNISDVQKKNKLAKLEAETRANMPFVAHVDKNVKRLSVGEQEAGKDTVNIHVDTDPHTDLEGEYGEIEKLMDDGNMDEAKKKLKGWLAKMKCLGGGSNEYTETATAETEKQLSAMAAEISKLEKQFNDLQKLASELAE